MPRDVKWRSPNMRWQVTIETLTPVHIGSGRMLQLGYELLCRGGKTYRLDQQALSNLIADSPDALNALSANKWEALSGDQLLAGHTDEEVQERFARYTMLGTPRIPEKGKGVQELLKDADDRPYIPGSTLKGALRTVLLWGVHQVRPLDHDSVLRGDRAAARLEKQVFGDSPHSDWLRALRVGDSAACESSPALLETGICHQGANPDMQPADPMEAIGAGAKMVSEIRIQRHLLSSRVAREVGWGNYSPWLAALCPLARAWTEQRIADEQRFFAAGPPVPQGTYTRLQKKVADLQPNQMVLQIGARTGWQAKTLGSVLQADSGRFEVLLAEHNMIGGDEGRFPGDPWPSTRTLTYRDDQWKEPLGWICLTIDGWRTTDLPTKFSPPRRPEE